MSRTHLLLIAATAVAGTSFVIAVYSSFTVLQIQRAGADPDDLIFADALAGLAEVFIGYESMIVFGGSLSLGAAESMSRLTGSRQVLESRREDSVGPWQSLARGAYLAYVPLLVFTVTTAISWDVFTADYSQSSLVSHLLGPIDIFSRPLGTNPIIYSLHVLPVLMLFGFLAGIVPSIALPYFSRFKVTGVNAGPFHSTLLLYLVGFVAGISVIFTLLGFFYKVLVLGKLPGYYHYLIILEVGLAICYGIGSYLGLGPAETRIAEKLASKKGGRVTRGTVNLIPSA